MFTYLREALPGLFKGSSDESCCVTTKNSYDKKKKKLNTAANQLEQVLQGVYFSGKI